MRRLDATLWALAIGLGLGSAEAATGRKALVIGNEKYAKGALANPVRDARAVAKKLGEIGFQVKLHENLGKLAMLDAVEKFAEALQDDDTAFFFYAGHGAEVRGKNLLLPVDLPPAVKEHQAQHLAYPLDLLLAALNQRSGGLTVVVLDACRDDPFTRSWSRGGARGFVEVNELPSQTYIAFSTRAGATAPDDSPFARALLENIGTPGLDVDMVFRRIRASMHTATGGEQVPWTNHTLYSAVSLNGASVPPADDDGDIGDLKRQAEWAAWLAVMKRADGDARALRGQPALEAQAWARFLEAYDGAQNDPFSTEDDELRSAAMARLAELRAAPVDPGGAWVRIAGGAFQMGSNDGEDDERPVHAVTVASFDMNRTEVTVAQYRACVEAGKCAAPETGSYGNWRDARDREDHPVNCVSWVDAEAYCKNYAGGRLPTEEEWEFAARGKGGRKYAWGDTPAPSCDVVVWGDGSNTDGCGLGSTGPVCSKPKGNTPEGLCDMSGNVWEWTSSEYCPYPSNKCANAARVLRGGGWFNYDPSGLRAALRSGISPSDRDANLGFRCAR